MSGGVKKEKRLARKRAEVPVLYGWSTKNKAHRKEPDLMYIIKRCVSSRDLEKASLERRIQRVKACKLIYRSKINKRLGDYVPPIYYREKV